MTINLTKNNEMVVKGKIERPLPTVTIDIRQEVFLKLLLPSSGPSPIDGSVEGRQIASFIFGF